MSPVQTFRIPAEPKRRRQVRITPSEIYQNKIINKCIYEEVNSMEKNRKHPIESFPNY